MKVKIKKKYFVIVKETYQETKEIYATSELEAEEIALDEGIDLDYAVYCEWESEARAWLAD